MEWRVLARVTKQEALGMKRNLIGFAVAGPLLLAMATASPVSAQKQGGTLTIGHFDSPASISLLEESTNAVNRPMMAVFNNLVMYDQNVPQNSPNSIVPELATGWSWNEEGTELTLPLRQGVKWHAGRPFTANDVKCTLDLLTGKSPEKLRINPRKSWWDNLEKVSSDGDYEVTFHLKRPQPAFLALLATGWTPIYPCHVSPRDMRTRPIGVGRCRSASTASRLSTSSPQARARSAGRCSRRQAGSGGCRPTCSARCRGMTPTSRPTARKRARSWRSSATGPTSAWRSRCRRATSPDIAIRR